jgi:Protein of unknown function (DUF2510)
LTSRYRDTMSGPTTATPGWYPDPTSRYAERRWDGGQWTVEVRAASGDTTADRLGTPVGAPPPAAPPAPARFSRWAGSHRRVLAAVGSVVAVLVVLLGSVVAVDHKVETTRQQISAEQKKKLDKATKDNDQALSDAQDQLSSVQSELSNLEDRVGTVESDQAAGPGGPLDGGPSAGGSATDTPSVAPCDLLTPTDVGFLLGITVSVQASPDPVLSSFECVMSTTASPTGFTVLVLADTLLGEPLESVVQPLSSETLVPLDAGDKGLGSVAFGVAHGAASKGDLYTEVVVLGGSTPLTMPQLQALVVTAVSRLH